MEFSIRTSASIISQKLRLETTTRKKRLSNRVSRKLRKKAVRNSIISASAALLLIAFAFIVHNTTAAQTDNQVVVASSGNGDDAVSNPLNQLTSAQIAVQVARMTGIYESTAVTNSADSEIAAINVAQTDSQVITKPEVVSTDVKTRSDIINYVTQPGDTVSSLAVKFGVTSNSILWSNGLTGNSLTTGEHLIIPPVNGIVYKVKSGDTIASIAKTYNSDATQITSFNDAEISGIVPGEEIVVPNGSVQASSSSGSSYGSNSLSVGYAPIYGYNGYDYGYCTWYVASQLPVPSNWGNASSWAYYAGASGWNVSLTPTVGAIAQTAAAAGGEGHVAIVDGVSADGTMIEFKDMNGLAGWGRVGQSGWVSAATYQHYISK